MKFVKIGIGVFAVLVLAIGIGFTVVSSQVASILATDYSAKIKPYQIDRSAGDLLLGQRIFNVRNGCQECHGGDLSGKKVIDDPALGTIHGPNLTSHSLKNWTDGEIVRAIRHAIGRDGKPLVLMPSH